MKSSVEGRWFPAGQAMLALVLILTLAAAVTAQGYEATPPNSAHSQWAASASQNLLWSVEKVEENGDRPSLALDVSDRPHIGFYSYPSNGLRYAYHDGSTWQIETVDSGVDAGDYYEVVGQYPSLALDQSGHPHISYTYERWKPIDQYTAILEYGALKYAYFDGTRWLTETVEASGFEFRFTSLALDPFDRPHIAYQGPYFSGPAWWGDCCALKYAYFEGSSWVTKEVDSGTNYVGAFNSLALDASALPHISYYGGNEDLKYAYNDGSAWHIETVDDTGTTGRATSLDLDTSGWPHISYYDYDNSYLRYAYYNGSEWILEVVDSTTQDATSLVLDGSNRPHIVYDDGSSYGPKHAYFNGTAWEFERIYGGGGAGSVSLVLDSSDPPRPHATWYDGVWLYYARGAVPTSWVYLPLAVRGH